MKRILFLLLLAPLVGCGPRGSAPPADHPDAKATLAEARRGFTTKLTRKESARQPVDSPPPSLFRTVKYESPAGSLSAYLTPDPKDGRKHPAIVWITGGDCNTIDKGVWTNQPTNNDQSARAFREAGVVMMFPSLRGGNDNPGFKEGLFGEVDDVIAAADFLAKQDFVDDKRIYLGGHSTGGTLVLLTSAATGRFRAVFSFGPADDVSGYGPEYTPFDTSNRREFELRSPLRWLHAVKAPTFVIEGTVDGNLAALQAMQKSCTNPKVRFVPVAGKNHFSVLTPVTRLLAEKVVADTGAECNVALTEQEASAGR